MTTMRERLEARFPNGIPAYLEAALKQREGAAQRRVDAAREAEEAKEREFQRKRALRRPPARAWLEHQGSAPATRVRWEPPETADELPPTRYRIHEGDGVHSGMWGECEADPAGARMATLYGNGPASVEACYENLSTLSEFFMVEATTPSVEEYRAARSQGDLPPDDSWTVAEGDTDAIRQALHPEEYIGAVTVTLTLTTASNGDAVGALGQHRDPPRHGRITPRVFDIAGFADFGIRGWYTRGGKLRINFDTPQQEDAFRAAGVIVSDGKGVTFNSAAMEHEHGELTVPSMQYEARETYTITIREAS